MSNEKKSKISTISYGDYSFIVGEGISTEHIRDCIIKPFIDQILNEMAKVCVPLPEEHVYNFHWEVIKGPNFGHECTEECVKNQCDHDPFNQIYIVRDIAHNRCRKCGEYYK